MRDTSKPPENQTLAVIESPDLAALFGEVGWTAALAIAEAADTAIIVGEVGWVPDPAALHEQAEIDAMVDRWEASDRARVDDHAVVIRSEHQRRVGMAVDDDVRRISGQQRLGRDIVAGVPHELKEQPVLGGAQRDRLAAPEHFLTLEVDAQVVGRERRRHPHGRRQL